MRVIVESRRPGESASHDPPANIAHCHCTRDACLSGCTSVDDCGALQEAIAPADRQAAVIAWVDSQVAAWKLAREFAIGSRVPRPGQYAIPLDESLGFDGDFVARVIEDPRGRPVAVFIGNAPYRGFFVDLVRERRHFGLPAGMVRLGDRVSLLCVPRD